MLSMKTPTIF